MMTFQTSAYLGKDTVHSWGESTHRVDSATLNDRVIIRIVVDRGDLQFDVGSKPWETGILHTPEVLSLIE
jgi:hypothetical protein